MRLSILINRKLRSMKVSTKRELLECILALICAVAIIMNWNR